MVRAKKRRTATTSSTAKSLRERRRRITGNSRKLTEGQLKWRSDQKKRSKTTKQDKQVDRMINRKW